MKTVIYLTAEEVLEIHSKLIEYFGGSKGLRDRGLLESALYRPQSGYYESIFEQGAALLNSLTTNHVFVDGNKRIAFTAAKVFLLLNDYHLKVSADEGEKFLIENVIKEKASISTIAEWFQKYSVHK